jgi:hypothetical protein
MVSIKRRTVEDTPIRTKREAVVETPYFCALDPNRALLRSAFLLNEDRNKYISVAFYPQQEHSVIKELGAFKSAPLTLTEHQFARLAEHLPALIQAICGDEYYVSDVSGNFKVVTGGSYQTARLLLGLGKNRKEIVLKLNELTYLNYILYLVVNQASRYSGAAADDANYSTLVVASIEFIEPHPHYKKQIQYPQLYEELKAMILI